jgi:peptide/nickel transport system substrate-binding protein
MGLGAAAGMVAASGASADDLPERGGSLRLGLAGRPMGRFDGRRPFDPIMRVLGHGAAFDCLTEIAADGSLRGELATGWEASPDARVWTFRLREDAAFHDGRPFGAEDVVATLKLHRAAGWGLAQSIAQVRRTGPYEVQVVLRDGMPALPFLLADPQFIVLPAHAPEAAMAEGIGTGLYRLEPGRTPSRAVLRRVDRHRRDGQAGWFDRLEVLALADPAARLDALRSGRVDAVNLADPAWEEAVRRHGRIALAEVRGQAYLELAVEGCAGDRAEAIAAAVAGRLDRAALLRDAFGGRGAVESATAPGALAHGAVAVVAAPERVPAAQVVARAVGGAARAAGLSVDEEAPVRIVARLRPGRPTEDWPMPEPGARIVPLRPATLIAHATRLRHGPRIGTLWDMDSARIAERWWYS